MPFPAIIAGIAGLASAASSFGAARSASAANKRSLESERQRREDLLGEIDLQRANVDALRDERDVPSELFGELVANYPSLLGSILPQLTKTSIDTTRQLSLGNAGTFLQTREKLYPGARELQDRRLSVIQSMDPENLGREELAGITRKLSPLIPVGTLNPTTGAVAGATTNPVSLYRNLISSAYQQRRNDYLNQSAIFQAEGNNAASRQQVNAGDFLNARLGEAFQISAGLASADIAQQQLDINTAENWIRFLAAGLQDQYNPAANNQIIAQSTQAGVSSLGKAIGSLVGGFGGFGGGTGGAAGTPVNAGSPAPVYDLSARPY